MPRIGGVAPDVGFIDERKRGVRCNLTRETGPCLLQISGKKCPQGVNRDDSGKICYERCNGNSPRKKIRVVRKEPLTAWAI